MPVIAMTREIGSRGTEIATGLAIDWVSRLFKIVASSVASGPTSSTTIVNAEVRPRVELIQPRLKQTMVEVMVGPKADAGTLQRVRNGLAARGLERLVHQLREKVEGGSATFVSMHSVVMSHQQASGARASTSSTSRWRCTKDQ